jgi:hypothetical protein
MRQSALWSVLARATDRSREPQRSERSPCCLAPCWWLFWCGFAQSVACNEPRRVDVAQCPKLSHQSMDESIHAVILHVALNRGVLATERSW